MSLWTSVFFFAVIVGFGFDAGAADEVRCEDFLESEEQTIKSLNAYIWELEKVDDLTKVTLTAEILDLLTTSFLPQYSQPFEYYSILITIVHTIHVFRAKAKNIKTQSRLRSFHDKLSRIRPNQGQVKLEVASPKSVLGIEIFDSLELFQITSQLANFNPFTVDLFSITNTLRLGLRLRKLGWGIHDARSAKKAVLAIRKQLGLKVQK